MFKSWRFYCVSLTVAFLGVVSIAEAQTRTGTVTSRVRFTIILPNQYGFNLSEATPLVKLSQSYRTGKKRTPAYCHLRGAVGSLSPIYRTVSRRVGTRTVRVKQLWYFRFTPFTASKRSERLALTQLGALCQERIQRATASSASVNSSGGSVSGGVMSSADNSGDSTSSAISSTGSSTSSAASSSTSSETSGGISSSAVSSVVSSVASSSSSSSSSSPALVQFSTRALHFGVLGLQEHHIKSILVKPILGSPTVLGSANVNGSGITLLSDAETSARGGVPCRGVIDRFCSIMLQLDASTVGPKSLTLSLRVGDAAVPGSEYLTEPIVADGTVQSAAVVERNRFRTVSIYGKAQEQRLSIRDYLLQQFASIAPGSFIGNDALVFDQYGDPFSSVDWRNNWANSVFDFAGSSWDSYVAPVPPNQAGDSPGGVAVTRCHIATAKHYPRGGGFVFHRRTGESMLFLITGQADTPSFDTRVYRIDPCLPSDFAVYALPNAADPGLATQLAGVPYVNNHYNVIDGIRRISITQISGVSGGLIWGMYNNQMPSFMQVFAQVGDSGSPSFIYVDGELVALSTFTYGGYGGGGPFFGGAPFQLELQTAIDSIPSL